MSTIDDPTQVAHRIAVNICWAMIPLIGENQCDILRYSLHVSGLIFNATNVRESAVPDPFASIQLYVYQNERTICSVVLYALLCPSKVPQVVPTPGTWHP